MIKHLQGDCRQVLKTLPEKSVHCCVTSPPYWGLRDYGHDGQLGMEATPEEYVQNIVDVFREVRRVLRDDATVWLNLGDCFYGGGWKGSKQNPDSKQATNEGTACGEHLKKDPPHPILKSKDLVGIPWRTAFALQAEGWYLRQDIIWSKPNPMPESVTDRCTKAHEYIFLLSKSKEYYYDADAIKEPSLYAGDNRGERGDSRRGTECNSMNGNTGDYKNKRSVWTVPTSPYSGAHFAVFPPDLIRPCILAGCPQGGTVLDPFGGSGTTGMVAEQEGRNAILIELNEEYIKLQKERTQQTSLLNSLPNSL